jgi:hypothetical protein
VTGAPPAGVPGPTVTPLAQRSRRLPRRWRNLLLITHIKDLGPGRALMMLIASTMTHHARERLPWTA